MTDNKTATASAGTWDWSFAKDIVGTLGPHGPDGVLCFGLTVALLAFAAVGVSVDEAGTWIALFYLIYAFRKTQHDRHLERCQFGDVRHKEIDLARYRIEKEAEIETERLRSLSASGSGPLDQSEVSR